MTNINKAAVAGAIFFCVILGGFVGIKVDQTTIALLGGALIGVAVAIPTTVLIIVIGMRKPDEKTAGDWTPPPDAPQFPCMPPHETHHHYHDNCRVVVNVNVPSDTRPSQQRFIVARELRVTPMQAKQMIDAGEVQCLPAGR